MNLSCKKNNYTLPAQETLADQEAALTAGVWQKYRDALISFLTQGNRSPNANFDGLKLVTVPIGAEWDQQPEQLQAILNQRQSWDPNFEMNMGAQGTFDSGYCDFAYDLNSPTSLTPSQDAAVKANSDAQKRLVRQLMEEEANCEDRFMNLHSRIRSSRYNNDYNRYVVEQCDIVTDMQNQLKSLRGEMRLLYNQALGGQKEVLAREAVIKCAENLNRKFLELTRLSDFTKRISEGKMSPFSVDISSRASYNRASSSYSSFGLNVFVVSFNSAKEKMQLTTKLEELNIKISAKAWTAIQVTPDPAWFEGDAIGIWKNGPFRSGKSSSAYFGPGGSISLLPRTVYVVYQPSIEITLNNQDAEEFKKKSSFSISLNIPFSFGVVGLGFGKSSSVHETRETGNLVRFRIENNSPTPQIIAMNNVVL